MRVEISKLQVENSANRKKLRVDILNIVYFLQKFKPPVICLLASIVISVHYFLIETFWGIKENTKITIFLDLLGLCSNNEVVIVSSKNEIRFVPTEGKEIKYRTS
jgi:hypothetical protein